MAMNLRKPRMWLAGNLGPREIVTVATAKRLATKTDRGKSSQRCAALFVGVLIVLMSGCRALSLIPHNHTCPNANPFFYTNAFPSSAHFAAIKQPAPHPPQVPPPMPPYGMPQSPPPQAAYAPPYPQPYAPAYPQTNSPAYAQAYPQPNSPSSTLPQTLAPVAPQSLPPVTPPFRPQGPPPVAVEDVVVEPSPTVVETLLTLRQEMQELRNDNTGLTKKLETFQEEAAQRARLNQRTSTLMTNVRDDLTTVQNEFDAWRSDLSTVRGRVRDQHVHHERTLVDVEKQLHDMISVYGDAESDSDK